MIEPHGHSSTIRGPLLRTPRPRHLLPHPCRHRGERLRAVALRRRRGDRRSRIRRRGVEPQYEWLAVFPLRAIREGRRGDYDGTVAVRAVELRDNRGIPRLGAASGDETRARRWRAGGDGWWKQGPQHYSGRPHTRNPSWRIWSATRSAWAAMVSEGFTAAEVGRKAASTTNRLA